MTVSVVGTIFLVNAEKDGSRVAVIEGEVRVREGSTDTKLHPGEQVSTNPKWEARSVKEAIGWSRQADAHLARAEPLCRTRRPARAEGRADPRAARIHRHRSRGETIPKLVTIGDLASW